MPNTKPRGMADSRGDTTPVNVGFIAEGKCVVNAGRSLTLTARWCVRVAFGGIYLLVANAKAGRGGQKSTSRAG